MFYSETLLAKTGPLARVWLAANLERKLTKQNVLSSNLEDNVKDIIGQGQAPMALRLSGQLLLGVVKIYSRKAKYLLDDCNDALGKLKIAFRPGNVDLPSHLTHAANPNTLILPDAVTELDLFAPLPDPEELLRDHSERRGPGRDPTLLDFGTSQFLPESQTPSRREKRGGLLDHDMDLDLDLDFGLEPGEQAIRSTPMSQERSVEIGRRAHTPARDEPTLFDNDIELDFGLGGDDTTIVGRGGSVQPPADNDMPMFDADDGFPPNDEPDHSAANAAAFARVEDRRQRATDSPLSDLRPSVERELDTFHLSQQQDDSTIIQAAAPQRVKRRKVMREDAETQLHNSQIKAQQADTSAITRAPTFLPRDPLLLQLMEMQRQGNFVSNLMGDGRLAGWAPELRGILSLEVVREAGMKKRKRDSGVADLVTDDEDTMPQLEIPREEGEEDDPLNAGAGAADFGADPTRHSDGILAPMSDGLQPPLDIDEPGPDFDVTEAPILHPAHSGPVSLGTKTAVHLLRSHFAPDHPKTSTEPPTPSKRVKAECMFEDLCPTATTGRQQATKMFFELLVLGTKDAIKVEQESGELGGPMRVRGKRGLWGDWAETSQSQAEGAAVVV